MTDKQRRPPRRINPRRIQTLLESIAGGQFIDVSSRMAGVDPSTVYSWVRQGKAAIENSDHEDAETVIAEWLDGHKDDFKADNPMWIMDPPEGFDADKWVYALFSHRFEKAKVIAEAAALTNIRKAARAGSWQADAWYLERTRPEKYGRKIVEHKGAEEGAPIKIETVDPEALMSKVAALAAKQGEK